MQVSTNTVLFLTNHQRELCARHQTGDPIDHVHTGFLERSGPFYICRFVEPRLELDHYGDLFAALSRFRQRGRDWRSTTGPIERLLDGQNIWIFCRLFNEIEHCLKAFIRMMQQDRFPADSSEHILLITRCGHKSRHKWTYL